MRAESYPAGPTLPLSTRLKTWAPLFLTFSLGLISPLLSSTPPSMSGMRWILLIYMLIMFWLAWSRAAQMARVLHVCAQMQAPHALCFRLVLDKLNVALIGWLWLAGWVVAGAGAYWARGIDAPGSVMLASLALISLAGCLGMLASLSRGGMLAPILAAPLFGFTLLLCIPLLALGPTVVLGWFNALPFTIHGACAVCFPTLALLLRRRWASTLPSYRWREEKAPLSRVIASQARRFTVLSPAKPEGKLGLEMELLGWSRTVVQLLPMAVPVFLAWATPFWRDGVLNLFYMLPIFIVAVAAASSALIVRDLHWRSLLLLPGGLKRGTIGFSIWSASIGLQLGVLMAAAIAYAVIERVTEGTAVGVVAARIAQHWPIVPGLMLITSTALLIRVVQTRKWFGVAVASGAIMALVLLFLVGRSGMLVQVSTTWFLGATLCATVSMLAMANRLWTTRKLFAHAGSNAT